jgi:hypothetical protein
MQIVPIIPQQTTGVTVSPDVKGVSAVKPVQHISAEELPALMSEESATRGETKKVHQEKRIVSQQQERRVFCRRIHYSTILEELRSSIDRRRNRQRNTDLLEYIDEEV